MAQSPLLTGITSLFERHLKDQNPHLAQLSYDIKDLYTFVDQLVSDLYSRTEQVSYLVGFALLCFDCDLTGSKQLQIHLLCIDKAIDVQNDISALV